MRKLFLLTAILAISICSVSAANDVIRVSTVNGYINEGSPAQTLAGSRGGLEIQLRKGGTATRWAFLSFPLDEIKADAQNVTLNIFLTSPLIQQPDLDPLKANLLLHGITGYEVTDNLNWNNKTEPTAENETYIGKVSLANSQKGKYLKFDVTDFVKSQKAAGKSVANFRMVLDGAASSITVVYVRGYKENTANNYPPVLIQDEEEKDSSITAQGVNGFIQQASGDAAISLNANQYIYLRNHAGAYNRLGFITFPLNSIDGRSTINNKIVLKIFVPGDKNSEDTFAGSVVSLFGIENYQISATSTWKLYDGIADKQETLFGTTYTMSEESKDTYLEFDVTDFVKAKKRAGATSVQFRLSAVGSPATAGNVYLMGENADNLAIYNTTPPVLDQTFDSFSVSVSAEKDNECPVYPTVTSDILNVNATGQISIYSMAGNLIKQVTAENGQISVASLSNGTYLLKINNRIVKFVKK
ncbi:DNRLRE domain-containing protein [Dysgonomonas sp. 520]|uniref:CBM96 family carbohydrate-binding protein n=1 Tax=Dysgonomonas sp. 520 TaxID=2302931 RepID=UPI0013CF6263|nr:DNRLRE domain-containing protein [Dysgonomonas sp. 520]NDW08713.1 T9SS C-terminal target domain-containing protein [Dysgonomonas sp. 520]